MMSKPKKKYKDNLYVLATYQSLVEKLYVSKSKNIENISTEKLSQFEGSVFYRLDPIFSTSVEL